MGVKALESLFPNNQVILNRREEANQGNWRQVAAKYAIRLVP